MASLEFLEFRRARGVFKGPPPDREAARKGFAEERAKLQPAPTDVEYKAEHIGGVACEWVRVQGAPRDKAVLYIHGGGFEVGSVASHRHFVAAIAKAAGVNTVSVEYRLAPENPYPAALNDCVSVYRGLLERGLASNKVVVAGESAGGNLGLALVLYEKDGNEDLPAGVAAMSPVTDFLGTSDTYRQRAAFDPMAKLLPMIASFYAPGEDLRSPLISPLYGDYHGFPRLFLQVGDDEVLVGDSVAVADKARAAGVEVTLRIWPEMGHAFAMDVGLYPEADKGVKEIGEFIRAALGRA